MKKSQSSTILQLPPSLRSQRLLARLTSRVVARPHSARTEEIRFFDSFDRDLWFAGLAFYRVGDRLSIESHATLLWDTPCASVDHPADTPSFWWDLPESRVTEILRQSLKLRALEPLVAINATSRSVDVMNEDAKTVVRLQLRSYHSPQDEHGSFIELCLLRPLRGYESDAQKLIGELIQMGLQPVEVSPVARVIAEVAAIPDRYPGEPALQLEATQPGRQAAVDLMRCLWSYAQSREAGIVNDTDTEFLHQYRVALRKVRSLLGQLKAVLPDEPTRELKCDFGQLARSTNRLRDLDVYLLSRSRYAALLPAPLQDGLSEMFDDFQEQREQELDALRDQLRSRAHQATVKRLNAILHTAERLPQTENACVPVAQLAIRKICRRYQKMASRGSAIDETTPAAELHALRIDGKKLRYLLEFFGSLFEPGEIAAITRRLKKLQDVLGEFNDLCVQQDSLAEYLGSKCGTGTCDAPLTASLGGLIGTLHQCQLEQRRKAITAVADFCRPDVGLLFDRLRQAARKAA